MKTLDEEYADAYVEYLDDSAECDLEARLLVALRLSDRTEALRKRGLTDEDVAIIQRDLSFT